jgi:hypothetical protein
MHFATRVRTWRVARLSASWRSFMRAITLDNIGRQIQTIVQWNSSISKTVRNRTHVHTHFFAYNDRKYDVTEYWPFYVSACIFLCSRAVIVFTYTHRWQHCLNGERRERDKGMKGLRLALSNGPNWVGLSCAIHLRTETDPVSETLWYFLSSTYKTMDKVQNKPKSSVRQKFYMLGPRIL